MRQYSNLGLRSRISAINTCYIEKLLTLMHHYLLDKGILDSSVVVIRHFSTPTSVLSGNGLAGFLRATCVLFLSNSLSILGCVWSCTSGLVCSWSWSLIRPNASSEIRIVNCPINSMVSRPPSRRATTVSFSSNLTCTLNNNKKTKSLN